MFYQDGHRDQQSEPSCSFVEIAHCMTANTGIISVKDVLTPQGNNKYFIKVRRIKYFLKRTYKKKGRKENREYRISNIKYHYNNVHTKPCHQTDATFSSLRTTYLLPLPSILTTPIRSLTISSRAFQLSTILTWVLAKRPPTFSFAFMTAALDTVPYPSLRTSTCTEVFDSTVWAF